MLSIADVIVIFNILKDKKRYVCTDIFFKASFNIIKKKQVKRNERKISMPEHKRNLHIFASRSDSRKKEENVYYCYFE